AGRTESALDPAPLSMYENVISYKSEYALNEAGKRQRFKVNEDGLFVLKDGRFVENPNKTISSNAIENARHEGKEIATSLDVSIDNLIEDKDGEFYRNWRPEIKSPDDIWNEI